jgi:hypothetical protein
MEESTGMGRDNRRRMRSEDSEDSEDSCSAAAALLKFTEV